LELGLINLYPLLFPWSDGREKIFGLLMCSLVATLLVRFNHLAYRDPPDTVLFLLYIALLACIALAVITEPVVQPQTHDASPASVPPRPPAWGSVSTVAVLGQDAIVPGAEPAQLVPVAVPPLVAPEFRFDRPAPTADDLPSDVLDQLAARPANVRRWIGLGNVPRQQQVRVGVARQRGLAAIASIW